MSLLPLPIDVDDALAKIVNPALDLLPDAMRSDTARVMMLAIALQESALGARAQDGGPAVGLWQMEQGGGIHGVLHNLRTAHYAETVCNIQGVAPRDANVYAALPENDLLAANFARLLLWADTEPLPALGDTHAGWLCYQANWRPGAPRPDAWAANYAKALGAIA